MKTPAIHLDRLRNVGDNRADRLVGEIFESNDQSILYKLLQTPADKMPELPDSALKRFVFSRRPRPGWYDQRRLRKGQSVFKQYALEIMTLLGSLSLPYCYAASPGNKALFLSDRMRAFPGKRLMDTASFVISVLTPGSLEEKALGVVQINKIRLIHALSRHHLHRLPEWNKEWGQPINQEDMAGTNLAFSYVILLGLQQNGFILSQKEKEDFLFVWRYIGYQLNIQSDLLPADFTEASLLNTIIKNRNFKKTSEGVQLTAELIAWYQSIVPPLQSALIPSQLRFNLGDEVAEFVGINSNPAADRLTSFTNSVRSIQNMISIAPDNYHKMIYEHQRLKYALK